LFLFSLTILIFYLKQSVLLASFTPLKQKAGDATEKDSKMLTLGVSRNFIHLLIHQKFIEIFPKK